MTKDITISLVNLQTDEAGDSNTTTLETRGFFYEKKGKYYLIYDETDPEDGGLTSNTIKVDGSKIELKRSGTVRSHMHFESGSTSEAQLITPLGTLPLRIHTRRAALRLEEHMGEISMDYDLLQGGRLLYHNSLSLRFFPTGH